MSVFHLAVGTNGSPLRTAWYFNTFFLNPGIKSYGGLINSGHGDNDMRL